MFCTLNTYVCIKSIILYIYISCIKNILIGLIITTSRYRISNFEGAATPVFLLQVFPRKIVRSWRIRFAICGKEARLPALLAARKRFGLQQVEL